MVRKYAVPVLVSLVIVFAALAVGAQDAAVTAPAPPAGEAPYVVPVAADGVQRVDVLGGSYFFKPKHIVVKANVPVELRIAKEKGLVPHNAVIKAPEAGIDFNIEMKTAPTPVSFTPTQPGTYPMVCTKKFLWMTHKEKGMEGVLEVVP